MDMSHTEETNNDVHDCGTDADSENVTPSAHNSDSAVSVSLTSSAKKNLRKLKLKKAKQTALAAIQYKTNQRATRSSTAANSGPTYSPNL